MYCVYCKTTCMSSSCCRKSNLSAFPTCFPAALTCPQPRPLLDQDHSNRTCQKIAGSRWGFVPVKNSIPFWRANCPVTVLRNLKLENLRICPPYTYLQSVKWDIIYIRILIPIPICNLKRFDTRHGELLQIPMPVVPRKSLTCLGIVPE